MNTLQEFLITGCSGAGKSTLLMELSLLGFSTVEEAGRRVVAAQKATGGNAYPWTDLSAFLEQVEALARQDLIGVAEVSKPVFFDRGLVDVFCGFKRLGRGAAEDHHGKSLLYAKQVLVAPPWPEIFETDDARQHDYDTAVAEHNHIVSTLPRLGYKLVMLPKLLPSERALWVIDRLGL